MRLIRKVHSMGRGATFGALAGLAAGLALAMPGAPAPGGVLHAVLTAAGETQPSPTTPHPTTTVTTEHHPTTTVTTEHPTTTVTPHSTTTEATPTTKPPSTSTTTAAGTAGTSTSDVTTSTLPSTCDGRITAFKVALVDDGHGIAITVLVSGHVGWMSAEAVGFGGAALAPIDGGFQGTITGQGTVAPGTEVMVGSCHNKVRASTVIGGGDPAPGATPTTVADAPTSTTAAPSATGPDLPAGCATAGISSVTAVLGPDGRSVTVTVLVTGDVGWMSGEVNGVGGIALHAIPGGFTGTLTSSSPVPPGTEVVVGTCGGKLRASVKVGAPT